MQIDGYSLDAQKARMKAYADFNDYQIVGEYEDARAKKQAIEADKITGDNIYKVLICFEKLYNVMNPLERKKLMEHLISEIQIYPERNEEKGLVYAAFCSSNDAYEDTEAGGEKLKIQFFVSTTSKNVTQNQSS